MAVAGLIDAEELAKAVGYGPDETTRRVYATAVRLVTDYAPDAPVEVMNEAIIRFAGYLGISDFGTVRSETLGPQSFEHVTNHAAMFRNCGAAALLTRYKRRRAGAI